MIRNLLLILLGISCCASAFGDSVPDPNQCDVEPWDTYGHAFMNPGDGCDLDQLTVTLRDPGGYPWPHGEVEVVLIGCSGLCLDAEDAGLSGITGVDGSVVLNPKLGGWTPCEIRVLGNGITIRIFLENRSTDWDGLQADGRVGAADFAFFAAAFRETQDPRADYDGDGAVGGADFARFACSFQAPDINPSYPDCE